MELDRFGCPQNYSQILIRDENGTPVYDTELQRPYLYACEPPAELRQGLSGTAAASTPFGSVTVDGSPSEYIPQAATVVGALLLLHLGVKLINRVFYIPLKNR